MPIPLVILITDLDLGGSPLMVRALAAGLRARGHFDPTVVSIAPITPTRHKTIPQDKLIPQDKPRDRSYLQSAPASGQLMAVFDPIGAKKDDKSRHKTDRSGQKVAKIGTLTAKNPSQKGGAEGGAEGGTEGGAEGGAEGVGRGAVAQMLRKDGINVESLNIESASQFPLALIRWVRLLRQIRPDVVHSVLIHANALATLGRPFAPSAKYIQAIHTLQERPHWHWMLQGILAGRADGLIAPHPAILTRIARYGPFEQAHIIPNGIDLQRFSPDRITPSPHPPISLPVAPRTIGYVGRFDPVKRLPDLINAFILVRNALPSHYLRLALVGYGPQEAALRRQVSALGLNSSVDFPGPTTTPEKSYKSFDCLCLPSDAEGFGLTVVEALATGIPVVAVATPAMCSLLPTEFLTGANAVAALAPAATPELLAAALIQVMTNPQSYAEATITARLHLAAKYSQEEMISTFENYLRNFSDPENGH